jgi:phage shock protein A
MAANQPISIQKAETEIAVLKVQVDNIEQRVGEIKQDVRDLKHSIINNTEVTQAMIVESKQASSEAHKSMNDKISSLEKWRWMMMGAGIALGALGHNFLGNILK